MPRNQTAVGAMLAGAICAAPAYADVTPQQVWANFQAKLAPFLSLEDPNAFRHDRRPEIDFRFTELVTDTGDVLITDMHVVSEGGGDRVTAELGDMTLAAQDDGTVLITLSGDASFHLWDGDKPLHFDIAHQDLTLRASGAADALDLDLQAGRLTVDLDDPRYPSIALLRAHDLRAGATLTGRDIGFVEFIGPSLPDSWTGDQAYSFNTYDYRLSALGFNVFADIRQSVSDPEDRYDERRNQGYYKGSLDADGVIISGDIRLPTEFLTSSPGFWELLLLNLDSPNYEPALRGIAGSLDYQAASLGYEVDFFPYDHNGLGDPVLFGTQSTGSQMSVTFDNKRLKFESYAKELVSTELDAQRAGPQGFFPDTWMARGVLAYADIPIGRTDEPAEYAVGLQANEIWLDYNMWGHIDPAEIWPREQAGFEVWVAGQANLNIDLYYPWQAGRLRGGQNAIEVLSVKAKRPEFGDTIARAGLGSLGLAGDFSFGFDYSDMDTFHGFPRPEGHVNMMFFDLDGLVDRLVAAEMFDGLDLRGMRAAMTPFLVKADDGTNEFALSIDAGGKLTPGLWWVDR